MPCFPRPVGGSIPPARVPPSGSQLSPPPENNGSFASRLLGLFGWKSAPQTQVASADPTTLERDAHSAATGSILAPKIKLAPQAYAVATANPDEPYTIESPKYDLPQMQQAVAELGMSSAAASTRFSHTEHGTARAGRLFDSRWSGLEKAEPGLPFNARWALDSK